MSYKIVAVKNSADSVIIGCIFKTQRWGFVQFMLLVKPPHFFLATTPTTGSSIFREDQQRVKLVGFYEIY
jgi:hypothetical protein